MYTILAYIASTLMQVYAQNEKTFIPAYLLKSSLITARGEAQKVKKVCKYHKAYKTPSRQSSRLW